jgi:uncharacterized membrane protein
VTARRSRGTPGGSSAGETGSVSLLILGFALILVLAIVGITAVSEVYLTRRSLASVADGAALAGAQSVDETAVVVGEPGAHRRLDPATVEAAVAANLEAVGAPRLMSGFGYAVGLDAGGTVVLVTVHARSRVGIASALLGSTTVLVREQASAVAADRD